MKNSGDTIGNRTRDLPACSTVPQPTSPPRTPVYKIYKILTEIQICRVSFQLLVLYAHVLLTGLLKLKCIITHHRVNTYER
jgi:hypothetical protein